MCTAYELGKRGGSFPQRANAEAIHILLGLEEAEQLIRPTVPALVMTADGGISTMRWGFSRPFSHAIVNAREDKLDSVVWKSALAERRCLIPAAAYYEWSGPTGHKRTHRFTAPDGGWLWIAGIWEENVELGPCFSMITTTANTVAAPVHNRMPAVLGPQEIDAYLDGASATFRPAPERLCVADAVNPLRKKSGPVQGELF
ncbi:MAG: SOS response-associated peptidase family protein [Luteolibacter sp.]